MFLHNLNRELLPLCWPKFKYFQISSNFVSLHLWNQLIKLCEIMIIHNKSNVLLNVRWYYKLLCKMASETWPEEVMCTNLGDLHLFISFILQSKIQSTLKPTNKNPWICTEPWEKLAVNWSQSKNCYWIQFALLILCFPYHFHKWLKAFYIKILQANNLMHLILKK